MPSDITDLLADARQGNQAARDELFQKVQGELHEAAERLMRQERPDHTLQPTALVNEVVVKILEADVWRHASNRQCLIGVAARAMRRILCDHARRRSAVKHGGNRRREPLDDIALSLEKEQGFELATLDRALEELDREDPRQREVIEYRFFGGFSIRETAELLDVSEGTVERDWRLARAKLYQALKGSCDD